MQLSYGVHKLKKIFYFLLNATFFKNYLALFYIHIKIINRIFINQDGDTSAIKRVIFLYLWI
jgi:hypothetical protein